MADFTISAAHASARQSATVAFADTGSENSRIHFYDATETLLATVVLSKPCGTISGGFIRLAQLSPSGDMIAANGVAIKAEWVNGANTLVAAGAVSDEAGEGPFVLQGTTGTQLYAGGRAILGVTEID